MYPANWKVCANCGSMTSPSNIEHRDGFDYCIDCLDSESDYPDEDCYDSDGEDEP